MRALFLLVRVVLADSNIWLLIHQDDVFFGGNLSGRLKTTTPGVDLLDWMSGFSSPGVPSLT